MTHNRRAFLRAVGAGSLGVVVSPLLSGRVAGATVITMNGAGKDIWGTADEFHYYYQSVSGDFDVMVHNPYIENTDTYAKAGFMVRETLDDDAKNVMIRHIPSNDAALQLVCPKYKDTTT